jgi:hypothetical protein
MICCIGAIAFAHEAKAGSISGKVMIKDGMPMADGLVYIFNNSAGPPPSLDFKYWRVPDEIVKTDGEGKFLAALPDGKYYLGAIKRKSGEDIGPLQEGDLFLPILAEGASRQHVIINDSATDIGNVTGALPYKKSSFATESVTAIEGNITDSSGRPVENTMIFAFTSPAMIGKPLFISEKTGKDGRYTLRVYQGGKYYLKIRNVYGGGTMKAGEIMGSYGQAVPVAVEVKTGATIKGINITGISFSGPGANKK